MLVTAPATPLAAPSSRRRPAGVLELARWRELGHAERAAAVAAGWLPPMAGADPAAATLAELAGDPVRDVTDYAKRLERAIAAGIDLRAARTELEPRSHRFPVAELRALGDDEAPGTFEAIVSVFGNVDSYGDRMVSGAFVKTLQPPPEGRGMPPVVWSHEWSVPPTGATLEAREVGEDELGYKHRSGLYIKGRLLVDTANGEDHAVARQVWAATRATGGDGRPPLREFSFGFRTMRAQFVEDADEPNAWFGEVREILEVELFEVGHTLVGANDATQLLAVKSRTERRAAAARTEEGRQADELAAAARKSVTEALYRRRPTTGGISR